MDVEIGTLLVFGAVSLCSAALVMVLGGRFTLGGPGSIGLRPGQIVIDSPHVYEFSEGYLVSPLDSGDAFLEPDIDRSRVLEVLRHSFDGLHAGFAIAFDRLVGQGEPFILTAEFGVDALSLSGRREDGRLVLTVAPIPHRARRQAVDAVTLAELCSEVRELRTALDQTDTLVWKTDPTGNIAWCNAAYSTALGLVRGAKTEASVWPVPPIFELPDGALPTATDDHRQQLALADGSLGSWYRIEARTDDAGGQLWVAQNIDRIVAAEHDRRSFVQTLSKTFAHMTTGLAVFDRTRTLMLFNPALAQLTTLAPLFLAARPSFEAFLDALREHQRVPEPKDYKSWRRDVARMEQNAIAGTYQELWSLPDGQTFRVIGRPHPDGAMALFFEDITSEMRLTRKFRRQLDLHQAIIDADPAAVVVFGEDGKILLSNAHFEEAWAAAETPEATLSDTIEIWRQRMRGGAARDAFFDALIDGGTALPWSGRIRHADQGTVQVTCKTLSQGAVEVRFTPEHAVSVAGNAPKTAALAAAAMRGDPVAKSAPRTANSASPRLNAKATP